MNWTDSLFSVNCVTSTSFCVNVNGNNSLKPSNFSNLLGVSPLVGLRDNGFVAGQAALKAESSKVAKHVKACLENQHVFIPFAFDTFGFLAPEAEEFLNRVQRVVQSGCLLDTQVRDDDFIYDIDEVAHDIGFDDEFDEVGPARIDVVSSDETG
ncbi:hypothetical protein Tco_0300994 [Tanacetum coccineum]